MNTKGRLLSTETRAISRHFLLGYKRQTAEVFYRLQVSPDNQLTIGYQVIVDPTFDEDTHVVGVFEMRWRVSM